MERINCKHCGKALEGGHERDSYDWCYCVRCDYCDKHIQVRYADEDWEPGVCDQCKEKGREAD